jgi:prepilin-type N-terminal cleavage/methylation domain-containing protein
MTRRDDPSILLAAGDAGMTLLELLLVVAIILIIAAVATPRLLRARTTANETAAIGIMRAISTAEDLYSKACASGGFAISLTTLGVPPPGTDAPFLSPAMTISATPQQDGYTFALAAGQNAVIGTPDCNGTPTATTFYATATPLTLGTSGTRAFAINPSHTIWQLVGQNPPTEPFVNPATPVH